jgi:outer membrane protein OmpA-like peptidoglycan-associated protein
MGKNENVQRPNDKGKLVQKPGICLGTTIWFNKAEESITDESLKTNSVLQKLIATLKEYPNIRVRIEGHTDQTGPEGSNKKLSEKRATSMASFFKREGIAPNRITSLGYGASCLVDSQNTTSAQAKNRRIELRIIQDD